MITDKHPAHDWIKDVPTFCMKTIEMINPYLRKRDALHNLCIDYLGLVLSPHHRNVAPHHYLQMSK
jgi:hypothetical protein